MIKVEADAIVSLAGSFCLSTKSVPKVLPETYTFKRNQILDVNASNTYVIRTSYITLFIYIFRAFFTEIVWVLKSSKPEDATIVVCRYTKENGDFVWMKTYDPDVALRVSTFKGGMVIIYIVVIVLKCVFLQVVHMGPVSFSTSTYTSLNGDTKPAYNLHSTFGTVFQIVKDTTMVAIR